MAMPRVVLITGAASGIGWSTAKAFSRSGWYTVIADLDGVAATARASELGRRMAFLRMCAVLTRSKR